LLDNFERVQDAQHRSAEQITSAIHSARR
jgi:hypothetical protein